MSTLADVLAERTREADAALVEARPDGWVRCLACGHACRIPRGARGVCQVRFNAAGRLRVPWGYEAGAQSDPIEKKPFFHAWPGSLAFSFGMLGCDLHCGYCQNWITSQALRDPGAVSPPREASPAGLVDTALRHGARSVVSTYNEPLITAEWAAAVFREARAAGLATGFVSNGNATPQVLEFLAPWLDLYKVDLKSFDDRRYRTLGGRLGPVTDTIAALHRHGIWLEVVTLLVPGFNDDPGELRALAEFLAGVSRDIPWHVTAFHPDYRMDGLPATSPARLAEAAAIGHAAGLRFVYAGNAPGRLDGLEDTRCPACGVTVISRRGFTVTANRLGPGGTCPSCRCSIPGRWDRTTDG